MQERLHLIHDVLVVDRLEEFVFDDCMQICVHEFKHQIEINLVGCLDDIQQLHHVLVGRKCLEREKERGSGG